MKKVIYKCFCFCTVLLFACSDNQQRKESPQREVSMNDTAVSGDLSIIQLDENLKQADSLVIVYYKDPHGTDSLRYTRYYTQYAVTDTTFIHLVKEQLTAKTEKLDKIKACRSEGKIWCFSAGDIFQTIYFSALNEECNFLYIIKNGQFYYSSLNPDFSRKLYSFKVLAKDPHITDK